MNASKAFFIGRVLGGDVVGPVGAVDNTIALFDGPTGRLIKNSDTTFSDLTSVLVWKPSGTGTGPTEFADFNDLWDAFLLTTGPITIAIDAQGATSVIPVRTGGGAYDFQQRATLTNAYTGTAFTTTLRWAVGTTIVNMTEIGDYIILDSSSDATPIYTQASAAFSNIDIGDYSEILNNTGGAPFLSFTSYTNLRVLGENSYVESSSGFPAVRAASGSAAVILQGNNTYVYGAKAVRAESGATLSVFARGAGSQVFSNALDGPIGSTFILYYGMAADSGSRTNTQANALGTFTRTFVGGVAQKQLADIVALATTAIPAGGAVGIGYPFSSTPNFGVFFGSGVPTLSAGQGSLYLRSDGSSTTTRMYVNTDGGTTWTAMVSVA